MIALVDNGGTIYRLPGIVGRGPCDVRRSWDRGITRQVAISTTTFVNSWVMLGATDGTPDVADGAEIPEVFRIAVVLAAGTSLSVAQRNEK